MAILRYTLGADFDASNSIEITLDGHPLTDQVEVGANKNLPSHDLFDGLIDGDDFIHMYYTSKEVQVTAKLINAPGGYLDADAAGFLIDLSDNLGTVFLAGARYGDELTGGNGNDTIDGGPGNDTLEGGDGADRYNFAGPDSGHDTIFGFERGADKIWLSHTYDLTIDEVLSRIDYSEIGATIDLGNGDLIDVIALGNGLTASDFIIENFAPTADILPVSYGILEQAALSLKGSDLLVGDPDSGDDTVTATLSVSSGILTVTAGTSGATVTDSGSASVTIEGSVAEINDLLRTNAGSTVTYTADSDTPPASATLTLAVNDNGYGGDGGAKTASDTATINITAVSDAPTSANVVVTIDEGSIYTFALADFAFADIEGDALSTIEIEGAPTSGTLQFGPFGNIVSASIAPVVISSLSYTPEAGANGDGIASFSFSVVDTGTTANGGKNKSATYTVTFNVTPVNDAPEAADKTITTNEDTPYVFDGTEFGFSGTEPDDHLLAVLIDTLPTSGTLELDGVALTGAASVDAADITAGKLAYMPEANANGDGLASFTFRVQDDGGTDNGGVDTSAPATLTLDVTPVNDRPTSADHRVTVNEDSTYVFSLADFPFADADGDALLAIWLKTNATSGSLTLDGVNFTGPVAVSDIASGKLSFTPDANANGVGLSSFTFQVYDSPNVDFGAFTYTMTVDVTAVSDAPEAVDKTVTTAEDTPYLFAAADFAFSDIDGDALAAVKIDALPASGSLELDGVALTGATSVDAADIVAGKLAYVPAADANGSGLGSFTFRVQDDGGTANGGTDTSAAATITPDVTPVNDRPVAADRTVSTKEDKAYIFKTADFAFSDVDGDALGAVRIKSLPKGGTLELDGHAVARGALVDAADIGAGKLAYVPKADVNGTRSFRFKVQDDSGAANDMSSKHKLSIDIAAVNDAPTLKLKHAADSIRETANTSDARKMADIIVRDVDGGTDTLSLGGKDKKLFVIDDGDLYLKAGARLDFETNPVLNVTVRVDDASVGRTPDARVKLAIAVEDVVETIVGDGHGERLTSGRASEFIDGMGGNDTIKGGRGADTIVGGSGADVLTGGKGHDHFVFEPGDLPPLGSIDRWLSPVTGAHDLITDFRPGKDVIDLSALDADSGRAGDQAFAFVGESMLNGVPHALIYQLYGDKPVARHTIIMGDVDGDALYDFKIVLKGHHQLDATDFVL